MSPAKSTDAHTGLQQPTYHWVILFDYFKFNKPGFAIVQWMHDLTGFQRDLLYVIAGREKPHGLAIKDAIEEYYGAEINHGRLYPNLDALVEKGLVEKGQIDRRTNSYSLTQRGERELEARREWEGSHLQDAQVSAD